MACAAVPVTFIEPLYYDDYRRNNQQGFTEGFDTPDLKEAKDLLEELSG